MLVKENNTLRGRWFDGRVKIIHEKDGLTIERGSLVRISKGTTAPLFLVYVVFKDSGKKWFPTVLGDCPSWLLVDAEKKRYRLGLREVILSADRTNIELKNRLVDGKNVRETYKIIKLTEVLAVEFRVNY